MRLPVTTRRSAVSGILTLGLGGTIGGRRSGAQSPAFPTQPVRVIIPFPPGAGGDIVTRILAERMGPELGQSVIVDNRVGGNGIVGMQAAARSRPNGYTLVQATAANLIVQLLQENVYDIERDFVPIFGAGTVPYVIATNARSSVRTIGDLRAAAGSSATGLTYGSGSAGSPSHLCLARLAGDMRLNATHVPYRGLNFSLEGLLRNEIQLICVQPGDVAPFVRAGDLRPLAVTANERLPELPDVPTMAELGFADFYAATWYNYFAPAQTPAPVIEQLHAAFAKAAADPGVQERLRATGFNLQPRNGEEVARFVREDTARWRRIIQDNNIRIEN